MACILKNGCAHVGTLNCNALEECGAKYALLMAFRPEGYEVSSNSKTVDALHNAGLVTKEYLKYGTLIRAI
jgi:hypothetical protein